MWKQQAILKTCCFPQQRKYKHPDCLWGLLSLPLRAKPRQSVNLTTLFHVLPRLATPVVAEHCGRVKLNCDGTRRRTGGGSEGETGEWSG